MQANERIWFWAKISVVFIVILAVFQLFRVNKERAAAPPVIRYTHGPIVEGMVRVPADGFLSYRINLNRSALVKGSFDTMSETFRIECLVLDDANYEKWKDQDDYEAVSETGHLPTAIISPRIGPGLYHLVLSGRKNPNKEITVEAYFAVD